VTHHHRDTFELLLVEVADAVARVIAQPAGERPLHTVVATVAQRQAPQAINDAVIQATLAPRGEKQELKK
jgi:hypothetical protein